MDAQGKILYADFLRGRFRQCKKPASIIFSASTFPSIHGLGCLVFTANSGTGNLACFRLQVGRVVFLVGVVVGLESFQFYRSGSSTTLGAVRRRKATLGNDERLGNATAVAYGTSGRNGGITGQKAQAHRSRRARD